MKNLLEEATRISNLGETPRDLLDSGSFDTTLQDFSETANDASTLNPSSPDQAIPSENVPLELEDIQPQWDIEPEEVLADVATAPAAATVADTIVATPVQHRMPAIVRLSPYLCLLLTAVSVAGWSLYLDVANTRNTTTLGAALLQVPRDEAPLEAVVASDVERFPFIDINHANDNQDTMP